MKINVNSWHFKVATFGSFGYIPPDTSFCSYVRRLTIYAPLLGITYLVFGSVYFLLVVPIVTLMLLVIGVRPTSIDVCDNFVPYPGLPIGSFRLYPWHVLLLGTVVGLSALCYKRFGWYFFLGEGIILAVVAVIAVLIYLYNSETTYLVSAWLRARKQQICPKIEFTEDTTSSDPNE